MKVSKVQTFIEGFYQNSPKPNILGYTFDAEISKKSILMSHITTARVDVKADERNTQSCSILYAAPRRGSKSELPFTFKSHYPGFWPRFLDQSSFAFLRCKHPDI